MSCKRRVSVPSPQEIDPCDGMKTPTKCVIESNALPNLGLPENSSQQEINLKLQTAIYNLSSTLIRPIEDEGIEIIDNPSALNFVGDAVTVSDIGGVATITISTVTASTDYIDDVQLTGQNLIFTGIGGAFNGSVNLSSLVILESVSPLSTALGTRLQSVSPTNGFHVRSNTNGFNGYSVNLTGTGASAYAGIDLINQGGTFTDATTLMHYSSGYTETALRNNGGLFFTNDMYFTGNRNTSKVIFQLGNQTISSNTQALQDNVLELLSNREVNFPSLTIPIIDAESTGKTAITREWIEAQPFGASTIITQDEGVEVDNSATTLNFVGAGVIATDSGSGVTTVTISSGGATELIELLDVIDSTPTNRNALIADGSEWVSRPIVQADISDTTLSTVAISNDYGDLDNLPTIPNATTGLEALDEGNGIGWRLIGRVAANYGNIGFNAIDFSYSDGASSTRGSTGAFSGTFGTNNINSGGGSLVTGYTNNVTAVNALVNGANNIVQGNNALVGGANLYNYVYGEISLGVWQTNYTPLGNSTTANLLDRAFSVGIGTGTHNRLDGIILLKNGLITAPSVTNALITAASGKALITKEYADANYFGGGGTMATTTFTPYSTITSTDGQAAVQELKDELDAAIIGAGTAAPPVTRTAVGGETTFDVVNSITASGKLFVDGVKLDEGVHYNKSGSVFTFTGYTSVAGHVQTYYPDVANPISGGGDMLLGTAQNNTALKTFDSATLAINNPTKTFRYNILSSAITANRNLIIPAISADDTYTLVNATQTLNNKSLNNPILVTPNLGTPSSGDLTNCSIPSNKVNGITGSGTTATIPLTSVGGYYGNMTTANTAIAYTTIGTTLGAFAVIKINAVSQPTVNGISTPLPCATFIPSTDMHMVIQYFGSTIQFFFISLS